MDRGNCPLRQKAGSAMWVGTRCAAVLALLASPACLCRRYTTSAQIGVPHEAWFVDYAWDCAGAVCIIHPDRHALVGSCVGSGGPTQTAHVTSSIWELRGRVLPNSWALTTSRGEQRLCVGGRVYDLTAGRLIVLGPPQDPLRSTQFAVDVPVRMSVDQLRGWIAQQEPLIQAAQGKAL